ncbi:MAG: copper amine oxidase N-terminal domain-containing protein [Clostridiales bacterium]|nr:copper amine oxidase N-terminal domain-containing protein [Clostridiales bacterium]
MKKLAAFICVLAVVMGISPGTFAYNAECGEYYDFAGDRYSISEIDTNGSIFAGVIEGKIAVSDDFLNWEVCKDLDDVAAVEYLDGKFCAVNKGYTYVSRDGKNWEKVSNNLPASVRSVIKNKNSAVVFVEDSDENFNKIGTGTYQSFDGINWNKAENIPEGATMKIINDKIFFASSVYMPGIYVSDTGESFEKLNIDGFNPDFGGMQLEYRGGEYLQWDFGREIEDTAYTYAYVSDDLVNWETKIIERPETAPHDSTYVTINGEVHQLTINGYDYVWADGEWKPGQYGDMSGSAAANPPFTYYNVTDYGILAWNTEKNCYFIDNSGNMIKYDGSSRRLVNIVVSDGIFYAVNSWNDDGSTTAGWSSSDGIIWEPCEKRFDSYEMFKNDSASNGEVTVKSDTIIRGSRRDYEGNAELTGTVTDKNGAAFGVAFENTKGLDYISIFGGDGWFIMQENSGRWYFTRDGITRGEEIVFPGIHTVLYSNGEKFLYRDFRGINHVGDMSQFAGLYAPDTVRVRLNGEFLSFVVPPVISGDRTLISVRFLFERMGARVDWDDSTRSITITYGGNSVKLELDSDRASVNGEQKLLDVPAQLVNEKTMIPLRFISEELGFTVDYDDAEKIVDIKY